MTRAFLAGCALLALGGGSALAQSTYVGIGHETWGHGTPGGLHREGYAHGSYTRQAYGYHHEGYGYHHEGYGYRHGLLGPVTAGVAGAAGLAAGVVGAAGGGYEQPDTDWHGYTWDQGYPASAVGLGPSYGEADQEPAAYPAPTYAPTYAPAGYVQGGYGQGGYAAGESAGYGYGYAGVGHAAGCGCNSGWNHFGF